MPAWLRNPPQAAAGACSGAETCKIPANKEGSPPDPPSIPMLGKAREPHLPLALQRCRLRAEEKTLDFEFEVLSAQFNQRGRYALRLTVENPLLQGSSAGIQLRVNSGEVTQGSTSTTDTIEQRDPHQLYCFQRRKFTFTLPRGKGLGAMGVPGRGGDTGARLCSIES